MILPGPWRDALWPASPAGAPAPARWQLAALAGRLGELSGIGATAQLTLAFSLVAEAQREGERAAWIVAGAGTFFPPDAAACGIDLAALPVVFAADAAGAARAADKLLRSGGFGLVVLDLAAEPQAVAPNSAVRAANTHPPVPASVPMPLLARLVGLAQQHEAGVLFLTAKPDALPSLGSLISLRCAAERRPAEPGRFVCTARALKDKRRGPGWTHEEARRGPVGLR